LPPPSFGVEAHGGVCGWLKHGQRIKWRLFAHDNAFAAIGGVSGAVVCDNLKADVTATCRYEPGINRTRISPHTTTR